MGIDCQCRKDECKQAQAYGTFLGNRYKNHPNIIWMIGGDIRGDVHPEVWDALARAIKESRSQSSDDFSSAWSHHVGYMVQRP